MNCHCPGPLTFLPVATGATDTIKVVQILHISNKALYSFYLQIMSLNAVLIWQLDINWIKLLSLCFNPSFCQFKIHSQHRLSILGVFAQGRGNTKSEVKNCTGL